ncbi:4a-hydroxytetrahydrobiopterin dehydratase [Actinacidiphila bryophytorum]|uniref:4a-hydroxytetrahydrobiopterin dehydratase n=1 Tax=Actinacidiphila bryophytorum TaxID=1436133 RepID=UPI002176ACE2|nr:4a-hydroxytetrahydrobiopterin dehydratase [Actinacidiphila bryophytorum]UWE08743.1 4a-hydroxytetrahydrobiopterin dehydratase [Actinacidiphila bryophytorum]
MAYADALSEEQVEARVRALPGWEVEEGRTLRRTYRLPHLPAAIFAVHVAGIQDELNHHSDLTLGYDTLSVAITTHAAGGRLTGKDFDLAARIQAVAPGHGAE